ncbi:18485_t:CDS:2 [Funneliformis geosporum]|uniref:13946_t:CDS:1 n=1 Tax=Funneliformis geosporum TaxID=1117311 RepID=A0A9W4WZ93_9GLOM|nr:13946_t:CDS:2 [Funneliformis geosporum]CAI2176271.1 18485_t:CDS:2 [Funneliformis geosporum]
MNKVKVPRNFKPLEFRKSVSKDKISTPIAISMKATPSILPPNKVIKALYDYDANGSQELSFFKGDFFHVIGNNNDPDWYEACNPATNMQGLVPVSYFQVLEKGGRMSGDVKAEPGYFDSPLHHHFGGSGGKPQPLYGIVLYDFAAERPDELDAKAGEPIIVIAQSNHEWFVAKPIGRLGGPGLIPVTFIEIRDHATGKAIENVQELMDKSVVPKVEEWKKMTQDYQENSINLGRLDPKLVDPKLAPVNLDPKLSPMSFDIDSKLSPIPENSYSNEEEEDDENSLDITSASVDTHYFKDDRYWFVIRVKTITGSFRYLYRVYEDFYEFQIELLNRFPEEAGRTGKQRILPFMPGPLSFVNESITSQRRIDLDAYVKELLSLPRYILSNPLINTLFGLKNDDVETDDQNDPIDTGEIITNERISLSSLDTSPIDPTPPMSYSNVFHQPKKQPSFNGGGKHNRVSSLTAGGQFIKSSRVHDDTPVNSNDAAPLTHTNTQGSSQRLEGLKIKIEHRGDLYAILLGKDDMNFSKFQKKLQDRFGGLDNLKYKDNGEFIRLNDEATFNKALKFGTKLLLSLDQ